MRGCHDKTAKVPQKTVRYNREPATIPCFETLPDQEKKILGADCYQQLVGEYMKAPREKINIMLSFLD